MNYYIFSILFWAAFTLIILMIIYPEQSEKIIDKIIGGDTD